MRAVSKIVPVVIIIIVAVAVVGVYVVISSGHSSPPPPPPPSGGNLAEVRSTFDSHVQSISNRDISSVMQQYQTNSLLVWEGYNNAQGLGGTYTGSGNIQLLYDKALGSAQVFNLNILSYHQQNISTSLATVNATLGMSGQSTFLGNISGTVSVQVNYIPSGSSWVISNETWNFITFSVTNTGGATTFPEWQRVGPPNPAHTGPDMVHNLAWIYAPAVAVFLYAFIISVAVVAVVKRTWKH